MTLSVPTPSGYQNRHDYRVELLARRNRVIVRAGGDVIADIFRERVTVRGKGSEVWGWGTAYGPPTGGQQPAPRTK